MGAVLVFRGGAGQFPQLGEKVPVVQPFPYAQLGRIFSRGWA